MASVDPVRSAGKNLIKKCNVGSLRGQRNNIEQDGSVKKTFMKHHFSLNYLALLSLFKKDTIRKNE